MNRYSDKTRRESVIKFGKRNISLGLNKKVLSIVSGN